MNTFVRRLGHLGLIGIAATAFVGCGGGGDDSPPSAPATGNRPPTISGSPPSAVSAGSAYSFQPSASDPDGDPLTFTVENKPDWAAFDGGTGRLSGTPTGAHAGSYANITIRVSDGTLNASLAPFGITVSATATGSATVSWTAPAQNVDGSPLTGTVTYRLYYGRDPGSLTSTVNVPAGTLTFVVDNLGPATWYFGLKTINSSGIESNLTNLASVIIN